jgi:hypothetical protein
MRLNLNEPDDVWMILILGGLLCLLLYSLARYSGRCLVLRLITGVSLFAGTFLDNTLL